MLPAGEEAEGRAAERLAEADGRVEAGHDRRLRVVRVGPELRLVQLDAGRARAGKVDEGAEGDAGGAEGAEGGAADGEGLRHGPSVSRVGKGL